MNVNPQNEDGLLEKAKFISGDFLNSVPDAMERFVPELSAEIEAMIKADQESDHPFPDRCINISITPEQLVRLVNGIKEAKRKKRSFSFANRQKRQIIVFHGSRRTTPV